MKSIITWMAVITLALTTPAFAALPQSFSYQGYLKDTNGLPVSTQVDITFRLYADAAEGAVALWSESQIVTPQNGIYSVRLGNTSPLPPLLFESDALYLGVQINSNAEMSPRQQILSVPFSFRTGTAETVSTNGVNTAAIADGAVTSAKLAAGSVTEQNIATGSITADKLAANAVTSSSIAWHSITPDRLDTAFVKTAGDSMSGPLAVISADPGTILDMRATNNTSTAEAVKITNSGKGNAFSSYAASTEGNAGLFSTIASLNNSNTLSATTVGGGNAGTFTIFNAASTGSALHASTNGAGDAIQAVNSGSGLAGHFLGDVTITGLLTPNALSAASVDTQALKDASVTDVKINSPISAAKGGTGLNTSTASTGSILYTSAPGTWNSLAAGTNGQVLKLAAGVPAWGNSGTVTSISAGTGLTATPSPIVSSGTITIDTAVVPRLSTANNFTGTQTIHSGSQVAQGLVVRGAGSQSANLQEWQDSSGGVLTSVSSIGDISATNLRLPVPSAASGLIYAGAARLVNAFNFNFFAGLDAGNLTTTGFQNTGIGELALASNSTGIGNTGLGYEALVLNTGGNANTALGNSALRQNESGGYNTAAGYEALFLSARGSENTASGARALYNNSDGDRNTASGADSLNTNDSGSMNVAYGFRALYLNSSGYNNTGVGSYALLYNSTGKSNTAVGYDAGETNSVGNANTFVGAASNSSVNNLSNATAIGYNAIVDASDKVRIGNSSITIIEGQVPWSNPSDIRLKTDVADVTHGLDFIRQLRPVEYRMKTGNGKKDFGFIAQEIEGLLGTDYNVLGIGNDPDRTLTLRYTDLIAPLVKAVQEQQAIIEQLKCELAEIKGLLGR